MPHPRIPARIAIAAALLLFGLPLAGLSTAAAAVKAAASITPVHSLAAMVMRGLGEPSLIVRPGASPHRYALRASEARALDEAEVVFWVGEALEAFLERPIETLAADASVVELADVPGIVQLAPREGGAWEAHDHEQDHEHDGGHSDEHDHHAGEEHDESDEAREHHHHEGLDPHLWLDPENAKAWLAAMADVLAEADPDNAAAYRANAEKAQAELTALSAEIADQLAAVRSRPYIVFHDAYQYFERRFRTNAVGAITFSDAREPSPARVAEIRRKLQESGAVCVFAEPQFEPKLIRTVIEGSPARSGVLDPLGADLEPGPDLYPTLLRNLAASLRDCLAR